ncbi:MAG: acyl CoA:acetate/3-ketoacid CoA transferase [Lachnospiraceae bacterium]|nr:acyl CoA:acetate/3-ketoacid CoA transferase [Lachnospiraceae bacterium]
MAKIITAQEAAKLIPDGATVACGGMGLSGWAEEVGCAIRDSFIETGHPCNLNIKQGSAMGDWKTRGITRLGEGGEGLVTKWSAAHIGSAFSLNKLAVDNKLECWCLPQGVIVNLWREIAAGRPGMITKVGLGTFVDPRLEGGRMNAVTKEDICKLIEFEGEEYLFYKSFQVDVAILRGTTADENGNVTFEHESVLNEGLSIAEAVKHCGGIVIVQVEYIAKAGTLHPKDVKIPGILVDYVVQATSTDACWQTEGVYYEPAFCGNVKKPVDRIKPMTLSERKVICRRCAAALKKGNVVNLGIGMAADTAAIVAEEGFIDDIVLSTESGMVGGVPAALPNFGSAYNPDAIMTHNDMFDLIDGGNLDVTVLGIGEIDEKGNNNVSKFGPSLTGPGGFINITSATKTVIFCGTFMAKGKYKIGDGKLEIVEEGKIRKFVKNVEQITFSAEKAPKDQNVLYVTERCVFKLIDGKLTLIEIAPGIDLEKDILANMDFVPAIADDLKLMDEGMFRETWGGLTLE